MKMAHQKGAVNPVPIIAVVVVLIAIGGYVFYPKQQVELPTNNWPTEARVETPEVPIVRNAGITVIDPSTRTSTSSSTEAGVESTSTPSE